MRKLKDLSKKSLLKIAAATSVALFSLLAVFTSTVAWFESVTGVNNSSNQMEVKAINGRLESITFHELTSKVVDDVTGNANAFTFDSEPIGTITYDWDTDTADFDGDTSVALDTYDPLNREKPLLMMFHLDQAYTASGSNIYINGSTNSEGFLGEREDDARPTYDLTTAPAIIKTQTINQKTIYYYWMTSVIRFYNLAFASDESLTYQYALNSAYASANSLPLLNSSERFVEVDNEDETSSFESRPTLFSSTNGQTIKNIGLVIDYYPDAIEYIYSTFIGDITLESTYEGILHFWCDWSLEVF